MDNRQPEDRDWLHPPSDPKDPRVRDAWSGYAPPQQSHHGSAFAGSNSYAASQAFDAGQNYRYTPASSSSPMHQDLQDYRDGAHHHPSYVFPPSSSSPAPSFNDSFRSYHSHPPNQFFDAGSSNPGHSSHSHHSSFSEGPSSHHYTSSASDLISAPSSLRDATMSSDDDLDNELASKLPGNKKRKGKMADGDSQSKKSKGDVDSADVGLSKDGKQGRVRKPTEKAKEAEAEKLAKTKSVGKFKKAVSQLDSDNEAYADLPDLGPVSDSEDEPGDDDDDDFFEDKGKGRVKVTDDGGKAKPKPKGKAKEEKPKDKGKARAKGEAPLDDVKQKVKVKEEARVSAKGGRKPGAKNFGHEDTQRLLNLVRQEMPVGQTGWNQVTDLFNVWAEANDYSQRSVIALKKRFQALVNTTKPTGQPEMRDCIAQAKDIDKEIRGKVDVIDVDDDDWDEDGRGDGDDDDPDDSGIELVDVKPSKSSLKAKTTASTSGSTSASASGPIYQREEKKPEKKPRRGGVEDLLSTVQASIDPAVRAQRDEARVGSAYLLARISALEAECREKDSRVEKLQAELRECERGRNASARETDNLRTQMQMAEFLQQMRGSLNIGTLPSFGAGLTGSWPSGSSSVFSGAGAAGPSRPSTGTGPSGISSSEAGPSGTSSSAAGPSRTKTSDEEEDADMEK